MGEGTPDWAVSSFDFSALEARFVEVRAAAMESKDFSALDALKAVLVDAGVEVKMRKDGVDLAAGPGFNAAKLETLV
ncbi:MAG: hypothetical protein HRU32_16680 [Rhodobacteraceae bacterium]|nr:hypothetical protein [Paracoccaceae bacterium]